jgi:hypothetical protein
MLWCILLLFRATAYVKSKPVVALSSAQRPLWVLVVSKRLPAVATLIDKVAL